MDPENTKATQEEQPKAQQQAAQEAEQAAAQEPGEKQEPGAEPEQKLTDKHGQEAISKGRYEREIGAKDAEIAELKKKLAELDGASPAISDLVEKLNKLDADYAKEKAERAEERLTFELKEAGCVDIDLAKKVAGDYETVQALKDAKPILFSNPDPKGSTGRAPAGKTVQGPCKTVREALRQM